MPLGQRAWRGCCLRQGSTAPNTCQGGELLNVVHRVQAGSFMQRGTVMIFREAQGRQHS